MEDEITKKLADALNTPPPTPIEGTRRFLHSFCSDADSLQSIREHVRGMIQMNPRSIIEGLASIDKLLAEPLPDESTLLWLVEYDAGWVLDDKSETGARAWLQGMADMLREEFVRAKLR